MQANEVLQNNKAHQVAAALEYHFSKRTTAYVEGVYQRASGDAATTRAWINGLLQPDGAASNRSQTLARIGMLMKF
jgi:predicted porin